MENLHQQQCVPIKVNAIALTREQINGLLPQVVGWDVVEVSGVPRLRRTLRIGDFADALLFANHIGEIAEIQGHHPRLIVE